MPKKRKVNARAQGIKDSNHIHTYARCVLEVVVIAVIIVAAMLIFFTWDFEETSAGAAGGGNTIDSQFSDYVRECSQGIPQACDKIENAAENVRIPVRVVDEERERLRQERIVK